MTPKRIMIVEDEALVALEIESYLVELGYQVSARLNSGQNAIKTALDDPPDLVLMDINLSGKIDGIDAAIKIRSELDIPIIFVTAFAEEEKLERAKLTLPYGYLLKPIQERELKTTISMAFYTHQVDAERKQSEKERRELEKKLFNAHKLESLGTLAGGIAHDFSNILQPIMTYADMIHRQSPPESKISIYSDRIVKASERAYKLVQQILTFSKQTDPDFNPLRLPPVINEVMSFIMSSISPDIIVKLDINENCGLIRGDVTQLHQILMNLVINAQHAMQQSGGILQITLRERNLSEVPFNSGELPPGPYAVLTLTDNGEGMTPEVMERIFDPYFTTKEKGKGTGLGLSVVKGIVESHGGAITVSSKPGGGTRFELYFPIHQPKQSKRLPSAALQPLKEKEQILLVDDENPILELQKDVLEPLGYCITTASSGTEGLNMVRANPDKFDLVITDLMMPDLTGDALTKELLTLRSDLPVIICTGFSEETSDDQIAAVGARKLLLKPIPNKELCQSVRSILGDRPLPESLDSKPMAARP